jgi:hypothetical protein
LAKAGTGNGRNLNANRVLVVVLLLLSDNNNDRRTRQDRCKKSAIVGRMSVCQLAMMIGLFIGIYSIKNFEDDGKRLACPRFRN